MKDFKEFLDFVHHDCMHEIKEIGRSFGTVFSDEDFNKIEMSEESLGVLMQVNGYTISQFSLFILQRYHEWTNNFPENHELPLDL